MTDTGATSPGTMADDDTVGTKVWPDVDNAKVSDNSYTSINLGLGGWVCDYKVHIVKADDSIGEENKDDGNWPSSDEYNSYGNSTDLWSEEWTAENINDENFGVVISAYQYDFSHFLKATNFGFSIPGGATINGILAEIERHADGATAYIDHIRITVYYTEGVTEAVPSLQFQTDGLNYVVQPI